MNRLPGSAEAAAYAVKDVAEIDLTARPYNRFEPHSTLWWLVPSTEWPAFRFGKLFFESSNLETSKDPSLYCGFYLEKGLAGGMAEVYPPALIMDGRWTWFSFLKSIPQGFPTFQGTIRFSVAASYINPERAREFSTPESFLAGKKAFGSTRVSFEIEGGNQLRCAEIKANDANPEIANHFKENLSQAESIPVLMQGLHQLPQLSWVWIDLYAGPIVPLKEATAGADKLWRSYLRPWARWLH